MVLQLNIAPTLPIDHTWAPVHDLKSIPLFSNLPDKEVEPFQNAAQLRSYKKGRFVYLQGDIAKFFYVVEVDSVQKLAEYVYGADSGVYSAKDV